MTGNALMNMNNSVQIIIRFNSDPNSNDEMILMWAALHHCKTSGAFWSVSAILKKNNILIHKYSYAVIYNLQQNEQKKLWLIWFIKLLIQFSSF